MPTRTMIRQERRRFVVSSQPPGCQEVSKTGPTAWAVINDYIDDYQAGLSWAIEHGQTAAEFADQEGDQVVWSGLRVVAVIHATADGPRVFNLDGKGGLSS